MTKWEESLYKIYSLCNGLGSGQKPNGGGGGACGCSSLSLFIYSVQCRINKIISFSLVECMNGCELMSLLVRPAVSFLHVYLYIDSLVHTYFFFFFCARVPGSRICQRLSHVHTEVCLIDL